MIALRLLLISILSTALTVSVVLSDDKKDPQILLSSGNFVVTEQDLEQELLLLSELERNQKLANPNALKELLRQIYLGKRLAAEAERLGLDQQPEVQAKLAVERRWTLSKALRAHIEQQIKWPDFTALARENYAAHRDNFQSPEQFRPAHILKKVRCNCERDEQRRRIEQLLSKLQAGEDFATLAKSESEDTSNTQGGDLGWLKSEQLTVPFASAMAKLSIGQLSDVVETEYGFHIIKLLDHQPARQQSFEEVQKDIEQNLQMDYLKTELSKKGSSYLPGADAKYNESALEVLSKHGP